MNYHWNWHIFWEDSPDGVGTYLDTLIAGMKMTLLISLSAWVVALLLGALIGTMRTLPSKWAGRVGNAYVELFRNVPLLVQMFLWFYVVPEMLPKDMGLWVKQLPNSAVITGIICLAFFTSSRVAEQVRAGIMALPRGQGMAGTAIGLTTFQNYCYVLLPQAFRIIIPSLTNEFLNIIKNSAVALTISVAELTQQSRTMAEFSFQVFEALSGATVIYLLVNIVVVNLMRLIERKVRVPGLIAVGGGGH